MIFTSPTNTKLLVHASEADGSTTPADSSAFGRVLTAAGNAKVSADHACLGNKMLKFDGAGDYFSLPYSTDLDFGSDNFTVDCQLWLSGASVTGSIFAARSSTAIYGPISLHLNAGKLVLYASTTGSSYQISTAGLITVPVGQLNHLAVVRNGTQFRVYLNGAVEITATLSGILTVKSQNWTIGAGGTDGLYLAGYVGELRVLKGEAAWTAAFTPPAEAYLVGEQVISPGFSAAATLLAGIALQAESPGFSAEASLSATLFEGIVVESPGFAATASLASELSVVATSPGFSAVAALAAELAFLAAAPGFTAAASLSASVALIEHANPALYFLCVLTGAPDGLADLALPLKSFQAQHRASATSYLSVVVPDLTLAAAIADRPNGELVLRLAKAAAGVIYHSEELLRVAFEDLREDEGGRNRSITLAGYGALTNANPKVVALQGATYRASGGGEVRYRLAVPEIFLRPGDTATCGTDSFLVETVSYSVSDQQLTCEVAN